MIHPISKLITRNFKGNRLKVSKDEDTPDYDVTVFSSGTKTNYGTLLIALPSLIPSMYTRVDDDVLADITNNNRGELVWYIDGSDEFTIKGNLPKVSKFAITESENESSLYISKPSHAHIGSGKFIMIGHKEDLMKRPPQHFRKEKLEWVVQPLLTDILLWKNQFKFDLRLYSVIYNIEDKFYAACYRTGIGRVCVNIHDPVKDPSSAITNISIQEKIPGYDHRVHMPLIYDDIGLNAIMMKDLLEKSTLTRDPEKEIHILILGLDIIFGGDGRPYLIEVNKDPALEWKKDNNEAIASKGFILGVFGYLIPALTRWQNVTELDGWDIVS